ncbi:hypothetical protein N0V88_004615 [Collariella sp. IMI 366227]|nr:hypothetical protein N0V88_004615 [Collariella sp. IMI 366227]
MRPAFQQRLTHIRGEGGGCDGVRPICSICRDRGTACEFDTNATETHTQALKRKFNELQSQKAAFEQVYEALQTRSDQEAEEVFRRIRRGADAFSILRHVNYGDVLVQLALVPEARFRYEFPYLPNMPPYLRHPDNPYLDSDVYECTLREGPILPPVASTGKGNMTHIFAHRGLQNRSEFWNPKNLGYQFLAEAKRLYETQSELETPFKNPNDPNWGRKYREWEQCRLVTIQAAVLLGLVYNLNGSDRIGWRIFTLRATEMANEMDLLGPPQAQDDPEMQCARTYTAWGLFCWQSLVSYVYLQPPPMKEPPQSPLPDPIEYPQWYGELWVKYPLSQTRLPTFHGLIFKAKADFWTIINSFAQLAFADRHVGSKPSVHEVLPFYHRLRAWERNLPEPLTPRKIVLPHQLKLHMLYNHMLIDVVELILGCPQPEGAQLAQVHRDAYNEAVLHFETLIRLYYLRHGFESTDIFLLHFLGFFNHITMKAIETSEGSSFLESRRSTLVLVTKGIRDQGQAHYVARAILRFQVNMMRPEDLELMQQFVEIGGDQVIFGPLEQTVHTDWPVYDIGLEAKAEKRRQGKTLASSLASLILESPTSSSPDRSSPSSN